MNGLLKTFDDVSEKHETGAANALEQSLHSGGSSLHTPHKFINPMYLLNTTPPLVSRGTKRENVIKKIELEIEFKFNGKCLRHLMVILF